MENEGEGNFISRLFKKRKTPDVQPAPIVQETSVKAAVPIEKGLSGSDSRKQKQNAREKKLAQSGFSLQVEQAKTGQTVASPPVLDGAQIKKASEQVAISQSLDQAADIQEKFAPKGTPKERLERIIKNPPVPTIRPIYTPKPTLSKEPATNPTQPNQTPVPETPIKQDVTTPPNTVIEQPIKTVATEKKGGKLNPVALAESLKNPISEWGKKKESPKPVVSNESVAPFAPGSFPGVDKWKPGKGAIKGDVLNKVYNEAQQTPKYDSEQPAPQLTDSKKNNLT